MRIEPLENWELEVQKKKNAELKIEKERQKALQLEEKSKKKAEDARNKKSMFSKNATGGDLKFGA